MQLVKEMAKLVDIRVVVDGENGMGGGKLEELNEALVGSEIEIRNLGRKGEGVLNEKVGTDYMQKEKITPSGFGSCDEGERQYLMSGSTSIRSILGSLTVNLYVNKQPQESTYSFNLGNFAFAHSLFTMRHGPILGLEYVDLFG